LWLQDRCVFMHQNATSWHPLAQRYAERYMRARPTGVIVDYAVDERLVGIPHRDGPMQALTMTSVVRADRVPSPGRRRLVPRGPWGEWLSGLLGSLGIAVIERAPVEAPGELGLEEIERNPAVGLLRRVVVRGGAAPLEAAGEGGGVRTELLHLPCDGRMAAFPALERAGYVPVGVRPHATREDEVVLQRLPGGRRREAMEALAGAALIPRARTLVEGWRATCARTS